MFTGKIFQPAHLGSPVRISILHTNRHSERLDNSASESPTAPAWQPDVRTCSEVTRHKQRNVRLTEQEESQSRGGYRGGQTLPPPWRPEAPGATERGTELGGNPGALTPVLFHQRGYARPRQVEACILVMAFWGFL